MNTLKLIALVGCLALPVALTACGGGGGGGEAEDGGGEDGGDGGDGDGGDGDGGDGDGGDDGGMPIPSGPCVEEGAPAGETLIWKRAAAFDADLRGALELDVSCVELGTTDCADAHLIPLGGNEPFDIAMYSPVDDVLATSSIAAERMVLGACLSRASLDEAGDAVVFTEIDFGAGSVDQAAAEATAADLFRRLLGRDATEEEVAIVAGLAEDADPLIFATTACLAVGSTTEFTFL